MVATTDDASPRATGDAVRLTLGVPAALAFGALALVRRDRALHPVGVAFHATLELDGPAASRTPELGAPGTARRGVVRLSRGGGLPEGWPDIHGIALRLPAPVTAASVEASGGASGNGNRDGDGDRDGETAQDLLWSSAGRSRVGRRTLRTARSFDGVWATSLTSFATGGRRVVWAAEVLAAPGRDAPPLTVEALRAGTAPAPAVAVLVATSAGPWERVGTIAPGPPLTPEEEDALAFSPWNTGDGIVPVGALNQVRDASYRASRRARRR